MLTSARRRPGARRWAVAVVLVVTVLAFLLIVLDLSARHLEVETFRAAGWDVDQDRSYIEVLGYLVVALAAVLLAWTAARRRAAVVLWGWALLLVVVVADDYLQWHERSGSWFDSKLSLPRWFGLREQDFGELIVWGLLGLGCLGVVAVLHLRSDGWARRWSWTLAASMVVLVIPAAVVDMIHIAVSRDVSYRVDTLLIYVEAAGEVVGMGLLLAIAILCRAEPPPGRHSVADEATERTGTAPTQPLGPPRAPGGGGRPVPSGARVAAARPGGVRTASGAASAVASPGPTRW